MRIPLVLVTAFAVALPLAPAEAPPPFTMEVLGSIDHPDIRVLLVPPTHGDPFSHPLPDLYLAAALRGIHSWERSIAAFTADHPQYAYLQALRFDVEVFDGKTPDKAGYDVIFGFVETAGPLFRGVAFIGDGDDLQAVCMLNGPPRDCKEHDEVEKHARTPTSYALVSLFGSAPRAGQTQEDFPEVNDLQNVAAHEFGHTIGLGHNLAETSLGFDLMNSPYPYIYGDGDPIGDGGERTRILCPSSLDLYGLARAYAWLPTGTWRSTGGGYTVTSPLPYKWYC